MQDMWEQLGVNDLGSIYCEIPDLNTGAV